MKVEMYLCKLDGAKSNIHSYFSSVFGLYQLLKEKAAFFAHWQLIGKQMCCFTLKHSPVSLKHFTIYYLFSCWSIRKKWNDNDLSDILCLYSFHICHAARYNSRCVIIIDIMLTKQDTHSAIRPISVSIWSASVLQWFVTQSGSTREVW